MTFSKVTTKKPTVGGELLLFPVDLNYRFDLPE